MSLIMEQMPIVLHALNIGFLQTLKLFLVTLLGAIPLGLIISLGSMTKFKPLQLLSRFVVWVVRGTPLMIQLLIIYYFPGLVLHNPIWGGGEDGRFLAASIAFIINYACYFSEIYRGGIQGIPIGQDEAGLVLGMTRSQIFFKVKLLQMVKRIVPPMSNEIITLVKDTALARALSVIEIIAIAYEKVNKYAVLTPLLYAGLFYLAFSGLLTILFHLLDKKLSYYTV